MRRFFNWLKALWNRMLDKVEDPDMMLDQARRDMQSALIANREKAVQAITQKNRLQQMLEETRAKSEKLEKQATMALKQENRELAAQFMREKINTDTVMAQLSTSYDQAAATVEQVKVAIKRQEEEVRRKTAEALAMKAQWKNAQIQNSIAKALEGLTFEEEYGTGTFAAASERIKLAQSEAAARQEMHGESIAGKVMAMEDKSKDYEAEAALEALEARLKASSEPAQVAESTVEVTVNPNGQAETPAAVDPAVASEAEKQLEELEKRLQGGA